MKILCIIDSLGSGGAQRQLVDLGVAFKEKGHDVCFLVYHSDGFYYDYLKCNSIPVVELLEKSYLKRIFKIRKFIRNGSYDSILSFLEVPNFICEISTFPWRKWRLVVGERSANPRILSSLILKFYRFFHLLADAVVANSYENLKMVRKVNPILSHSKSHVIYNMVDFEKWSPKPDLYKFRANGKLRLIVAARHHYLKNLNCLVEAIKLLDENEKFQLDIAWYGRTEDDSYLKAVCKIKEYNLDGIFHFYPATTDIQSKINSSDAVGLFSFYEGLPNTICEAMINSKLVVSSNVSDVNRFIDSSFIFDPNNEVELSLILKKILTLSEAEFKLIGEINRERALKLFDKNNIINMYLDILS